MFWGTVWRCFKLNLRLSAKSRETKNNSVNFIQLSNVLGLVVLLLGIAGGMVVQRFIFSCLFFYFLHYTEKRIMPLLLFYATQYYTQQTLWHKITELCSWLRHSPKNIIPWLFTVFSLTMRTEMYLLLQSMTSRIAAHFTKATAVLWINEMQLSCKICSKTKFPDSLLIIRFSDQKRKFPDFFLTKKKNQISLTLSLLAAGILC